MEETRVAIKIFFGDGGFGDTLICEIHFMNAADQISKIQANNNCLDENITICNNLLATSSLENPENKELRSADNLIHKHNNLFCFECPNCAGLVEVEEIAIACGVFRHGIYKSTYQPIPPHCSETECNSLIDQELIYGCAKPFYFDGKVVKKCGYI